MSQLRRLDRRIPTASTRKMLEIAAEDEMKALIAASLHVAEVATIEIASWKAGVVKVNYLVIVTSLVLLVASFL